jgi:hypothetical protein
MSVEEVAEAADGVRVVTRRQGLDSTQSRIAKHGKAGLRAADIREEASAHDRAGFAFRIMAAYQHAEAFILGIADLQSAVEATEVHRSRY